MIAALGYVADVAILGTYALLARTGKARPFHWANALGVFPVAAVEVVAHAWPVMPLTLTFGVLGWVGVLRGSK